ncbi:MAG: hypothetical protein J6N51_13450 [Selenomonas sp.]|nr:hypothetical protein [Selenomonas sp.]
MKTNTMTAAEYRHRMAQREMVLSIGHAVIDFLEYITPFIGIGVGAMLTWFCMCLLLV